MILRRSRHLQRRSRHEFNTFEQKTGKTEQKRTDANATKEFITPFTFIFAAASSINSQQLIHIQKERRKKTSSSTPRIPPLPPKAARVNLNLPSPGIDDSLCGGESPIKRIPPPPPMPDYKFAMEGLECSS
ncbi:hypothetical protein L1987_49466 [Smallanthus sonchifolius]|uniref:Uncharacterized protein n=1 Tax=Smallanthus sonchifolius TaxID=185202 RepID=A0ACB9FVT8_9ASTR|nr:hypothetical protein L1987_49466 [Smallanthus sonchifolius]